MALTRRSFLEEALAAGALTGILSASDLSAAALQSQDPPTTPLPQGDLRVEDPLDFWDHFFDEVDPHVPKTRGPKVPPSERQVEFFHVGSKGLRYAYDIHEDELLDHSGDVQVSMVLGQFRPGNGDQSYLKNVKTSQLRVDCVQTKPFMEILAPLAWCAMASLKTDQAGKIPSLQTLGFDSPDAMSGVTKILLPGGTGKIAVNVYSTKGASFLARIMKEAIQIGGAVAPILNFPAISIPALKTFSAIYSKLEEQASFLMKSTLTRAIATKQALEDPDREETYVHLLSGDYVLVPRAHIDDLKSHLPNLTLQQGYLIEKNASQADPLETRANQALPNVTYATVRLTVTPVTGAPSRDAGGGGGDTGGGGGAARGGKPAAGGAQKPKPGAGSAPCGPSTDPNAPKKKP